MDQKKDTTAFISNGPEGHRGRMRARLLARSDALADYEILEMLLFLGIPRRDTKPQAKGLVLRFGSLSHVLAAEPSDLRGAGLPSRAIEAIGIVVEAARSLARAERVERTLLGSWDAIDRYLDAPARSHRPPGLGALLLNNRNQLLGECQIPPGAEPGDHAAPTSALLRQALERHATAAIILRHCGEWPAAATAADHALHRHIRTAAAALSVTVHDMLVVGQGHWTSLRQPGGH